MAKICDAELSEKEKKEAEELRRKTTGAKFTCSECHEIKSFPTMKAARKYGFDWHPQCDWEVEKEWER